MKFSVGDRVYWPSAPTEEESCVACVLGIVGIVTHAEDSMYEVTFNDGNDPRAMFVDDELVSEAVYFSPLYKALE